MKPDYARDGIELYQGDCLALLPELEAGSVDCLLSDPPYYKIAAEDWDKQWKTPDEYLAWLETVVTSALPSLAANASFYLFASPHMAGRVECLVRRHLNVLACIVWNKGQARNGVGGTGIDISALRTWWQSWSERIIFAERYGCDCDFQGAMIDGNRDYWTACEDAKRGVFGGYLKAEFTRAGVTQREIAALFPSRTGGLTGCVSNWLLGYNCPTPEQYQAIRDRLNTNGEQYLRREYEDLRRPFSLRDTKHMGDVWDFAPPRTRVHSCQKPVQLLTHAIETSTREGMTVLDMFTGSGSTAIACIRTGRKFIGMEIDEKYFDIAVKRIEAEFDRHPLFDTIEPENQSELFPA